MKTYFTVIAATFLLPLFSGCAQKQDPQTLQLRLRQDLTTLDPAYIVDLDGGRVAAKLFNGLVRYNEKLEIAGDLAERWEVSANRKTYRFFLRKNVLFSNGRELQADDVRYSFERVLNEKTLSPRRWSLSKIEAIRTPEKYVVELQLQEPYAPILALLTLPSAFIVPREEVERPAPAFARRPAGSGPFILADWKEGIELVLEKNPRYFGAPAKVERLRYRIIPEDFTAVGEFERGGLDAMEIPRADYQHFIHSPQWSPFIVSQTSLNTYYLGFNCRRPPFNRPEVRRAASLAIQKENLLTQVLESRGELSQSPVPPFLMPKSQTIKENSSYDPELAKKLLSETGAALPLRAKLYFNQDKESLSIVTFIKEDFSKIGIELELVSRDWSALKEALNKGEADCFLLSWWADYPDVENFLFPTFHSQNFGSGGNRAFYSNPDVDRWLEEAQQAPDDNARRHLYAQSLEKIIEEAPWACLWHRKDFYIHQPRVKNFRLYPVYTMEKGTDFELANSN